VISSELIEYYESLVRRQKPMPVDENPTSGTTSPRSGMLNQPKQTASLCFAYLPSSKGQLVDPCVVGISCAVSIHLKMDAKTVGAWLSGGMKRLIDGILDPIQS
jgi:hypothetical protein